MIFVSRGRVFILVRTSSFVVLEVQAMLRSIRLYIHISNATSFRSSSCFTVHGSQRYKSRNYILQFTVLNLTSSDKPELHSTFLILKKPVLAISILLLISLAWFNWWFISWCRLLQCSYVVRVCLDWTLNAQCGSFKSNDENRGRPKTVRSVQNEERIPHIVETDPNTSNRKNRHNLLVGDKLDRNWKFQVILM